MAKKFVFRLESLLNLKAHKVKEIEEAIQKILYFRYRTEEEIQKQEAYLRTISNGNDGHFKALDLQAKINHKEYINAEIEKLRIQLERIAEIENIYRQRLAEAMKEEKILEKLKDKKLETYNEEVKKEETKQLDEITINKEARKKNIENKP
jgi:flagellar FliJ protein